uniref:reelin domain-containing protein 1-like n=1 Tax=Epinephelus lanceolatus TaxID=310571 RepID=UPI001444A5E1|nr:reelin domain-containing protein 1-like [Epinephelus lanceolatus]
MQPTLQCFGVGVVLLSLAPPTMSFSRGASHVSCREMIPGHISAQPQDPQRSHVTLHTSASSYLPGQLVTVTVRSSRDFMGFLLQARSVEGAGVKARTGVGVGAGLRSTRVGPVLLGGSWTLTPPGTHTLRCLSEGDTLTHSDKQLKRNLSFVWKAPDAPMGDIKFYITVVQSYFVYWAGIDSAVVHDGSRSPWSGSNITKVDEENSDFVLQQDEALPGMQFVKL